MKFVYLLFFLGLVAYAYAGKGWKKEIKKLKIRIDQLEDKIDAMNCHDGHCLSKQKTSKLSTSVFKYDRLPEYQCNGNFDQHRERLCD